MRVITGFHAIEEELRARSASASDRAGRPGRAGKRGDPAESRDPATKATASLRFSNPGPRARKILAAAAEIGIGGAEATPDELNRLVASLPETARDHRGIVLVIEGAEQAAEPRFDDCLRELATKNEALVLVLDSITDPHNVGAIIRSADQFGVDLVVLPERRGVADLGVVSRASAGASAWVKTVVVPNLVNALERLKEAGFWAFGADADGEPAPLARLAGKTVLVMGSEGKGLGRLLSERCDAIVSIPTAGRLDSLNVSVAAGILLYEIRRRDPRWPNRDA